jgi:hypothetical protein
LAENALQQVNRFGSQFAAVIEEPIIARALSTLLPVVSILLDDSKSKPHPFLLAVSEGPQRLDAARNSDSDRCACEWADDERRAHTT